MTGGIFVTDAQRFIIKLKPGKKCILWPKARGFETDYHGYGRLSYGGFSVFAHRFSYMVHVGPITAPDLVCHKCDTPACVNPKHLFLGDMKANFDDMVSKGRHKNTFFYINGRKTHCLMGHEYTKENTLYTTKGSRYCRRCASIKKKFKYQAKKERAAASSRNRERKSKW